MGDSEHEANTSSPRDRVPGLSQLFGNVMGLPGNVRRAFIRQPLPLSARTRSQAVFDSLFLHIHSVHIHRWSLKKTFTLGLGIATTALFFVLLVTGIMLMLYYKPTTAEAYNSVKDIHYVVTGGRLLRNIHRWATPRAPQTLLVIDRSCPAPLRCRHP